MGSRTARWNYGDVVIRREISWGRRCLAVPVREWTIPPAVPHKADGSVVTADAPRPRPVTVGLRVSDLERSVRLYRDAFALEFHVADHDGDDEWTSGRHAATTCSVARLQQAP